MKKSLSDIRKNLDISNKISYFSSRQAGKQASRQAGKQASRQAGKQASPSCALSSVKSGQFISVIYADCSP